MASSRNRIGGFFLLGALGGYLLVSFQPWLPLGAWAVLPGLSAKRLVQAFFEASLVGALADWFAVTALFRAPLGLRLPHTSIIAKNKDVIAEAVPRFLLGFVTEEKVAQGLAQVDFAQRFAEVLSSGGLRAEVQEVLRGKVAAFLTTWPREEGRGSEVLSAFVADLSAFVVDHLDPVPGFARILRWARKGGYDGRIVAEVAAILSAELGKGRQRLAAAITPIVKRNAGWKGIFIGQGTLEDLLRGIEEELVLLSTRPDHELRAFVLASLERYADSLEGVGGGAPGEAERLRQVFREALGDRDFQSGLADFVADLLCRLGEDLGSPEGRFLPVLAQVEAGLSSRLAGDEDFRLGLNRGLSRILADLVVRSRLVESLSAYLADLLKATEAEVFVARIEAAVWNDLQYIRVNGAVVGGLVGLGLTLLSALFPA